MTAERDGKSLAREGGPGAAIAVLGNRVPLTYSLPILFKTGVGMWR